MSKNANETLLNRIQDAVESGDISATKSLLESNPDQIDSDRGPGGWLHCSDDPRMTKLLIDLGCNLESTYTLGKHAITPAMTAISNDQPEILKLLLANCAKLPPNRQLLSAIVGQKNIHLN